VFLSEAPFFPKFACLSDCQDYAPLLDAESGLLEVLLLTTGLFFQIDNFPPLPELDSSSFPSCSPSLYQEIFLCQSILRSLASFFFQRSLLFSGKLLDSVFTVFACTSFCHLSSRYRRALGQHCLLFVRSFFRIASPVFPPAHRVWPS